MRHWIEHAKDRLGLSFDDPQSIEVHLEAAARWLLEAQRATADDGIARSYDVRTGVWAASHPETTGSAIPTLYDYARYFDRPVYRDAALAMARWEVAEQLPDGGIRAGRMTAETIAPTVVATGRVLLGLARAAKETDDVRIYDSLVRAADWLVAAQETDGGWRRFAAPSATSEDGTDPRSAFGLVRAFEVVNDRRYLEAADRHVAWTLSNARPDRCLPLDGSPTAPDEAASTHAIADAIRGILEVGVATENPTYLKAAIGMGRQVAAQQNADGSLSGALSRRWEPLRDWSDIGGNSQMAINWFRIAKVTGDAGFERHAWAANRFNTRIQKLAGPATIRGAVKETHPIGEGDHPWRYSNGATQSFMDGLMFERLFDRIDNIG